MEKIITITLGVALIVSNALPGPIELTLILYAAFAMAVGYGSRLWPKKHTTAVQRAESCVAHPRHHLLLRAHG